jgi:hypothetical protein
MLYDFCLLMLSQVIEEWLTSDGPMLVDFGVVRGPGSIRQFPNIGCLELVRSFGGFITRCRYCMDSGSPLWEHVAPTGELGVDNEAKGCNESLQLPDLIIHDHPKLQEHKTFLGLILEFLDII